MVAPLVMLAAALASKLLQDKDQENAYQQQVGRSLAETQANIAARRAARAGDSGYMQAAMGATGNFPRMPESNAGSMLASVGSALLSQREAPESSQPTAAPSNAQAAPLRSNYLRDVDDSLNSYDRYRGWG